MNGREPFDAAARRRVVLERLGAALAIAAASFPCAGCAGDDAARSNLVLVVVDTLRADHTSLAGYAHDTTPALASFARERGIVFGQARSTAPWTKPSMASLFTGFDPRKHGVLTHLDALHAAHATLAEAFAGAGWETLAVQSNLFLTSEGGFAQGFARYADALWTDPTGTIARHDASTGERVNAVALQWLDERDAERPFFLYVHHYEPHHRYLRDALVPADAFGVPADRREALSTWPMNNLVGEADQMTPADVAYFAARYDSEILWQDELLGGLLDGLAARELLDTSVIAVTADHGEEFLEHGDISHHNDKLFDELLRVPLVLAIPGRAPARIEEPVSLRDLGRTLLDACGLAEVPFAGRSMEPLLDGARASSPIVAHGLVPGREGGERSEYDAIVNGGWKLVRDLAGGGRELYDLRADPDELVNRFESDGERAAELERALAAFMEREATAAALGPDSPEALAEREQFLRENAEVLRHMGYY